MIKEQHMFHYPRRKAAEKIFAVKKGSKSVNY